MKVGSEEGKTVGFGYAENISVTGLAIDAQVLIKTEVVPSIGDQLRMRFKLPSGSLYMSVTGRVVRIHRSESDHPLIGTEFIDLPVEFRDEISRYVVTRKESEGSNAPTNESAT